MIIQECSSDVSEDSYTISFMLDILVVALRASTYLSQLGSAAPRLRLSLYT